MFSIITFEFIVRIKYLDKVDTRKYIEIIGIWKCIISNRLGRQGEYRYDILGEVTCV